MKKSNLNKVIVMGLCTFCINIHASNWPAGITQYETDFCMGYVAALQTYKHKLRTTLVPHVINKYAKDNVKLVTDLENFINNIDTRLADCISLIRKHPTTVK